MELLFIIKRELFYKEVDFLQNSNQKDVHIDQVSKIMS